MMPAGDFDRLIVDGVTVDYGRSRVLSKVAFSCPAGTITGLFGPNGAGKTTLLRLVSGRARPSKGRIGYGAAFPVSPTAAIRGRIGWLGHDPALYPELSAAENLRFFAALHGVADPETRVADALVRAALADRAGDPVGSFSRGMRQRIGLERALLAAPRLVLLDEPFTGLDDRSARALVGRLDELRRGGTIVLLSTHDPAGVAGVLDAAVVLRGGRLVARLDASPTLSADLSALAARDDVTASDASRRDLPRRSGSASPDESPDESPDHSPDHSPDESPDQSSGDSPDESAGSAIRRFGRAAGLVVKKDVLVELRSRELAVTTLFFSVVAVLVFAFAFVHEGETPRDVPAAILWVTMLFAGTLALGRAFDREHAHQTLSALLSAPVHRAAIYVGKLLGLLVLLGGVLAIVIPLAAFLFQAPFFQLPGLFVATVAAGVVGLVAVGALFAAMLVRTRSRDVLLPVLLYPMVVPVMLAGVRGTAALLLPVPDRAVATMWLSILVAYDAVFVTLALWVFDAVTAED